MSEQYHQNKMLTDTKGFTLLEVLFAMAIASFGFMCLALMHGASAQGNVLGNRVTQATYLAQQGIEAVKSAPVDASVVAVQGAVLSDVAEVNLDETGAATADGKFTRRTIIQYNTAFSRLVTVNVSMNTAGWDPQSINRTITLTTTTRGDGN